MLGTSDASQARGAPRASPPVRLQTFFDALAAGLEMDSLTQLLRDVMMVRHASVHASQSRAHAQTSVVVAGCKANTSSRLTAGTHCMSCCRGGEDEGTMTRSFWRATKAALLFSVESNAATEEVTLLYYAPETWSCLRCARAAFAATAMTGATIACDVPALLSSRVTTELARQQMRETRDWQRALAMLRPVDRTSFSVAFAIELCSQGGLWQEALAQLDSIAAEQWTEMDVTGTMRAMYHAARAARQQRLGRGRWHGRCAGAAQGLESAPPAQLPLCLLRRCAEHGVRLSAPSAVNDALGMLSLLPASAASWHAACELLDALVQESPAALKDDDAKWAAKRAAPASPGSTSYPLSILLVRANAVTVYQVCSALQARWELALHYTAVLERRYAVAVEHDRATVQLVLQACVAGGRWQEAMMLALRYIQHCARTRRRDMAAAHASSSAPFLNPHLFLELILLFNQASHADAARRLLRHASITQSYHGHIVRQAYNTMLQYATTVDSAEIYKARLERVGNGGGSGAVVVKGHAALEARDCAVANASYEHLTTLYAMDGRWLDALRCFRQVTARALGPGTRHQCHYKPTAQLHDTIQYALEQVPLPGPPWALSVQIFAQMLNLQAPLSPIALQCVWRKCVKHGAFTQAQQVLAFCMRKGIQR